MIGWLFNDILGEWGQEKARLLQCVPRFYLEVIGDARKGLQDDQSYKFKKDGSLIDCCTQQFASGFLT